MKKSISAIFLVLVLLCACILPVTAQASGTGPLVLHSSKNQSGTRTYFYDTRGNCVREEWTKNGKAYANVYTYGPENYKILQQNYIDNRLITQTEYDPQGQQITEWRAEGNGSLRKIFEATYQYDSYGRKILREEKNLESGDSATEKYEYAGAPRTLVFGRYDQDNNWVNGAEPIEWIILDTDGEYSLVISKYGLDSQRYEKSGQGVSWNESDLRRWLGSEFALFAFTVTETMNIRPTQLENAIGKDQVFLLSVEEASRYLASDARRLCTPTATALNNKGTADIRTGTGWWTLRTAGSDSTKVARVNADGSIDRSGVSVSEVGGLVRPAMWVRTAAASFSSEMPKSVTYQEQLSESTLALRDPMSTTKEFDEAGRMIRFQNHTTGQSLERTYDDHGQIIREITCEGGLMNSVTRKNTYDNYGQLIESEVRYEEATLDAQGRKGQVHSSSAVITCSYDDQGRMISRGETHDDGSVSWEMWTYDATGRLLMEAGQSGSTTTTKVWTYANDGSSTCQTTRRNASSASNRFQEYDAYGNLLRETADGIVVQENTYVPLSQAQWTAS